MPLESPWRQANQIDLTIKLESWQVAGDVEYAYSIDADNDRSEQLNFYVRDYCLGVDFTNSTMLIEDDSELVTYINTTGDLLIGKQILTEPTFFYLGYPTYF